MNNASFLHAFSDILRGDYKRSDFGKVILPFTLLRRLECIYKNSEVNLKSCLVDSKAKLLSYIKSFPPDIQDIFERFEFNHQVEKLSSLNLLT
jgi:type I restriction enzyme M protein